MPFVALLDPEFVLKGFEKVPAQEAPSQYRIPVPDDCDLMAGKYKWDHTKQTFLPVAQGQEKKVEEHNVLKAVARALMAIRDGKPLPKVTLDWLADYAQSMDNKD